MSSVDVIVPCYRYGRYLRKCVVSALSQSGAQVRVLIIDDASPDNTSEIASELARQDQRIALIRHRVNRGHIATYNEGLEWGTAKYLLLLSADDFLLPGALHRATSLMEKYPVVGFVFGKVLRLTADGTLCTQALPPNLLRRNEQFRILGGIDFIKFSAAENIVPSPTAVVRTDLQRKIGGYRSDLPHAGDMEMWLRLASHAAVGVLNARQAVYRLHDANMSSAYFGDNRLRDLEQRKAALDHFFAYTRATKELQRRLSFALARDAVMSASGAFNEGASDLSQRIGRFARELYPDIRMSPCWLRLMFKRAVGQQASLVLRYAYSTAADFCKSFNQNS